jgi:hypothetical protein
VSASHGGDRKNLHQFDGVVSVPMSPGLPADDELQCSSISSSDIRNCNKNFLRNYDQQVAEKVWRGALGLGVEVNSVTGTGENDKGVQAGTDDECILYIHDKEQKDVEARRVRREHQQSLVL